MPPTLLIVGAHEHHVLEVNKRSLEEITCPKKLEIVLGATHLVEEPWTLERVARSLAGSAAT